MPTLTAGIGLLVLLAVGAVMVVHWIVDRDVVQDFATALVMRVLSAEEAAVRRHLDAASISLERVGGNDFGVLQAIAEADRGLIGGTDPLFGQDFQRPFMRHDVSPVGIDAVIGTVADVFRIAEERRGLGIRGSRGRQVKQAKQKDRGCDQPGENYRLDNLSNDSRNTY